jgi:cyclopropane-fatty-acyl-phospholipid synthase
MSKLAKKLVIRKLSQLQAGQIILHDEQEQYAFGQAAGLSASVQVVNSKFYTASLLHGSLGIAQSYIDGDWQTDNLTTLIRIVIQNEEAMRKLDSAFTKFPYLLVDLLAKIQKNTVGRARKYIHAHYDMGNEFFNTFLGDTLMYSCGIFETPEDTLECAQMRKINRIVEKLAPKPDEHILEIGTGWGTFAIYLAQNYGCRVTTTTISDEQYRFVEARILKLNLQDRITLLNQDYGKLQGKFDKIVSIEMIEAVGHQYFDAFFAQCDQLLKPGGLLMIQAIIINEQTYEQAKKHLDFIKKHIFPGSCLPSVHRMGQSIANHTNLQWLSLNDIGRNYTTTLLMWHERFMQNLEKIRQLGFSEEFIRLWQYYLCYCAAGFQEDYISDVQLLLRKRL